MYYFYEFYCIMLGGIIATINQVLSCYQQLLLLILLHTVFHVDLCKNKENAD